MTASPPAPLEHVGFWRGPFAARTWREQGYLATVTVTGVIGLAWFVLTISLIPSLAITVVGLLVGGGLVVGARAWGAMHRALARRMLRHDVEAPAPWRRPRGFWRTLAAMLGDATGWRALAFMLTEFVLGLAAFAVSLTLLITSLGAATHWFWSRWLPLQQDSGGVWHRGSQLLPGVWVEGWRWNLAYAVVGLLLLFVWARVTLALGSAFRGIVTALLGPTRTSARLQEVERTRRETVTDSDQRLRQIERDLHDGTQARLVAVAMQLGEARDQLERGGDAEQVRVLVGTAHDSTKEAMSELRAISRGIRPASLDSGLVVALETLTARSALPVTLDAGQDVRASPEVEAIAYYCVAELLANAIRHAGASHAVVTVDVTDDEHGAPGGRLLVLGVRDDGDGGAAIVPAGSRPVGAGGTGLRGIVARIAAVDGRLELDSPAGGPTVATVTLPISAAR